MKPIDQVFNDVVSALNRFGVRPIIYGSYGLHQQGLDVTPNDLDFLLDSQTMHDRWSVVQQTMIELGYAADPEHNQEFGSDELWVSFLSTADIEQLIGHSLVIQEIEDGGRHLGQLDLAQHKEIYEAGLKDKWRRQKKEKSDLSIIEKIAQQTA